MNATRTDPAMVVGVGASAGGLQAFKAFLSGIPETEKFAYVLIQHLNPDHESELSWLLQPSTPAEVEQIEDGCAVAGGRVFVIPPGKALRIADGAFVLSEPDGRRVSHSTVDTFLRSLASQLGSSAACVILSGSGSDGALGLKAVKEAGGVCLVQDPDEAEHDGMPRAAVRTGLVDVVAPAAELGGRLAAFVASDPEPPADLADDAAETIEGTDAIDGHLDRIFELLRERAGQDFSSYRLGSILRRIHHRMRLQQVQTLEAYTDLLEQTPEESRLLARDFMISVTSFFRDSEVFADLKTKVIPQLFADKTDADLVRVWVAGCATGEEAYSLLMLLEEHRRTLPVKPRIQIFASDIDEAALDRARIGFYPASIAADVSPERLRRFFDRQEDGYRIRPEMREQVIFAQHNLLQDPPFINLDLVSCRNLLIYLQREVQERIISVFHYALRQRGFLFLGRSESPQSIRRLFAPVTGVHRAHRARVVDDAYVYPLTPLQRSAPAQPQRPLQPDTASIQVVHRNELAKRHLPPSILVDRDLEACHLLGDVGSYLRIEPGSPPRTVLQMVPPKLRTELRGALRSTFQDGETRTLPYVDLPDEPTDLVDVIVESIHAEDLPDDTYALVTFRPRPTSASEDEESSADSSTAETERLESELESVRHRLQTVTEEYETSTEELLASNEELEAANEELRATTEELEASREEIESTNEELLTLNRELEEKVERLHQTNSDLQNLMEATNIATLFLDGDLCLRQYTERATDLFNLIPTDVGRPFEHVSHHLEDDAIAEDAARVLKNLDSVQRKLRSEDDTWYKMRILPYRTVDDRIDGVTLTFVDVTDLKEAEERVERMNADLEERVEQRTNELARANEALQEEAQQREKARDHFRRLFRLGPVAGIITTLGEGKIVDVNQRFLALTGYPRDAVVGTTVSELGIFDPDVRASQIDVLQEEGRLHSQELQLQTRTDDTVDMMFSSELIERDETPLILSLGVNITARKKMEEMMRQARDEAQAMNQLKTSFIANMSHEIRTPLTGIIGFADVLGGIVDDDEALRYIHYVHANGKRLLETLDSVLDLARLDAEEIRLQPVSVNLKPFVQETAALFDLRATDKGLNLSVHTPDEPVRVKLDTSLVQRVLNNLLDNALKFTEDGSVQLHLRWADSDGDPDGESGGKRTVVFEIRDTGSGMSDAFQERLYQEFSQERSGTDRPQEGAGLGLAITHRLVSLMDGEIAIDSTEGEGTTATVTLPCQALPGDGDMPDAPPDETNAIRTSEDGTPTILVVDDRPEVGIIVNKFLADCDVTRKESAPDGIDAVQRQAFDVVLLDIQLGADGTGREVLKAIRTLPDVSAPARLLSSESQPTNGSSTSAEEDSSSSANNRSTHRDVPVVALTAHSLPGDRQRFLEEGFDAYLGKPFSRDELRKMVQTLLYREDGVT